jgi:uncharacterized protein (TIGR03067 family)
MANRLLALTMIAALLLGAWGLASGQDQSAAGKKDLEKIQGVWKFESVEEDGRQLPKDEVAQTITFKGDAFTVKRGDAVLQAGTHQLDPTKKPAAVDAKITEGEQKGATMLGIYELAGDTIKVCFDPMGKKRPTEFKAAAGSGHFLATLKREKK